MPLQARRVGSEMGTALAVLAMYFLLLLAPWHQASALQHDLSELGYASSWSLDICTHADDGGGQEPAHLKCPIASSGKFDFLNATRGTLAVDGPRVCEAIANAISSASLRVVSYRRPGQPRAPPVVA